MFIIADNVLVMGEIFYHERFVMLYVRELVPYPETCMCVLVTYKLFTDTYALVLEIQKFVVITWLSHWAEVTFTIF